MTRDENIKLIREKCVAAIENVTPSQFPEHWWTVFIDRYRTLHLADVLLAMEAATSRLVNAKGHKEGDELSDDYYRENQIRVVEIYSKWNLRKDDPNEQSDEFLEFLAQLLA